MALKSNRHAIKTYWRKYEKMYYKFRVGIIILIRQKRKKFKKVDTFRYM